MVGTDTLGQSFFFLVNLYQYNILENKMKNILGRRLLLNYDSTKIVIFVCKDIYIDISSGGIFLNNVYSSHYRCHN